MTEVIKLSEMSRFSNLGDVVLNFICSAGVTRKTKRPIGFKVSNKILSQALLKSNLANFIRKRINIHEKGDIVEAFFGYLWFHGKLDLSESITIIAKALPKNFTFNHVQANNELAKSIAKLINYLLSSLNLEIAENYSK